MIFTAIRFLILPFLAMSQPKDITFEQAYQKALESNFKVKTAQFEVEAARARFHQTASRFLPRVGADSRFEQFESSFQKQRGGTSNLYLEWNLFNGFRDGFDRKAKSSELEQAQVDRDRQKLIIKTDVESKFYRLLGTLEIIKAFEEALSRNEVQKESARKRRGAGLATDSDILEFDLYQTELQTDYTKYQNELKQAQAEFREILGESDTGLEFSPHGALTHFHVDEDLLALRKRALVDNQSLISARFLLDQTVANKRVALGGFLPSIDLKAFYGSRGINETPVAPETAIMGTARWELFSGFETYHRRAETNALADKAEANLKQIELSALTQVDSAFSKLNTIQKHVDIEAQNKVKAAKFFELVAAEYRRGVKNSGDIRAASQFLLQIFIRDIQYRTEFFEQKAVLEKAVGGEIKISKGSVSGHSD